MKEPTQTDEEETMDMYQTTRHAAPSRARRSEPRRVEMEMPRAGARRGLPRTGDPLAQGMGWFSIGLGLAQLLAPRGLARAIGVGDDDERTRNLMRACGLREITAGIGILTSERPAGWLWARLAGDVMDMALLGLAMTDEDRDTGRLAMAAAAVLGAGVLDVVAGRRNTGSQAAVRLQARSQGARVNKVITIHKPPAEVYRFWRQLSNLPAFMAHLESVQVLSDRRSRWKAKAPLGRSVEWEAEIVEDVPDQLLSWRSVEGADVPSSGTVRFRPAPGGRGTELAVELIWHPPGGKLGAKLARLLVEEPSKQVNGDLRRLKNVLETGEVVHSDASIHAGPHPARPSRKEDAR
jgi:uncharacterized membrane protein